jgi:RHS repeat-associated protein
MTIRKNPYYSLFQSKNLLALDEINVRRAELDEYYYGARYYNPRESVWLNVDPLFEKTMTPYQYTYQNPLKFIDPTGMEGIGASKPDDWFVNQKTGQVIFIKCKNYVEQSDLGTNTGIKAEDFMSIGSDNMLGDNVTYGGNNIMDYQGTVFIENPDYFMDKYDFKPAEKVSIKEQRFSSGGRMGPGENISNVHYTLTQFGDAEKTYVKSSLLNVKQIISEIRDEGRYSSIEKVTYNMAKTPGQSNYKTSYFSGQRTGDNISFGASILQTAIELYQAIFSKR